jgi:hypothetical protein
MDKTDEIKEIDNINNIMEIDKTDEIKSSTRCKDVLEMKNT